MQSHPKYPAEIYFKNPVENATPLKFNLMVKEQLGGLEYVFDAKDNYVNYYHYNVARSMNSHIRDYYLKFFKNEIYLEPFKNQNKSLTISPWDAETLHNKMPQLFFSYVLPKEFSVPQPAQASYERIQKIVSKSYNTTSISEADFPKLNPLVAHLKERAPRPKKPRKVISDDINKDDVEMMINRFQTQQKASEESIPEVKIDKENAQSVFQELTTRQKELVKTQIPSEINEKNLDGLFRDYAMKKSLGVEGEHNNIHTQLIKKFPNYPKKRKKRTNVKMGVGSISEGTKDSNAEEIINYLENINTSSFDNQTETENSQGFNPESFMLGQNQFGLFVPQDPFLISKDEESDVMKELAEFLQREQNAEKIDTESLSIIQNDFITGKKLNN